MGRGRGRASGTRPGLAARLREAVSGLLLGRQVDDATSERLREIEGLFLIGFSIWLLIAMGSYYAPFDDPGASGWNWGGQAGWYLANVAFLFLGWSGFLVGLLALAWGVIVVARKEVPLVFLRLIGGLFFVLSVALLLQLAFGPETEVQGERAGIGAGLPYGPGGWLALETSPFLVEKFGRVGLWVLLLMLTGVSFLLATDKAFYPALTAFGAWLDERRERRGQGLLAAIGSWCVMLARGLWDFVRGADIDRAKAEPEPEAAPVARSAAERVEPAAARELFEDGEDEEEDEEEEEALADDEELEEDEDEDDELEEDEEEDETELDQADEEEEELDEEEEDEEAEAARELVAPAASGRKPRVGRGTTPVGALEPPTPPKGPWTFPPLDLLEKASADGGADERFLESSAKKLENVLRSFRVEAEVVAAQVGPAVTLFELTVAEGTRMNKVTQLSQEIAAALRAQSVRIIAPIPGRATIGIEVPNAKRRVVRIAELIHPKAYDPKFMALPLFLGMDAEGNAIVEDLARMPHLLIAGTTGSGKSVCINTILASLLLTRSPHDVKMVLIDPKMVELQMFARVPHLMLPVVTDARQATNVLLWTVEKMDGRYDLFRTAGVKNIKSYNALGEEELKQRLGEDWSDERTPRHLPYIVVVIDEMADLMMTSRKEAELAITRLAQKSRAVGIHVLVATQRPSTDVITGVIKGNLPTRIAFQVASKVDSRVILDQMGAEKLLGGGDMLYTPPQSSQIRRVQGALVEDREIQALVDFVCNASAPTFDQEMVQTATGTPSGSLSASSPEDDPMWDEAVRVILKSRRGSASLLQRALGVGYTRASRLIDMMTEEGIVGQHKGSKAREVLLTLEDWEEMHGSPAGQGAKDE